MHTRCHILAIHTHSHTLIHEDKHGEIEVDICTLAVIYSLYILTHTSTHTKTNTVRLRFTYAHSLSYTRYTYSLTHIVMHGQGPTDKHTTIIHNITQTHMLRHWHTHTHTHTSICIPLNRYTYMVARTRQH